MTYPYPAVGAQLENGSCKFCVWAPRQTSVILSLLKDGTHHPMTCDAFGFWSAKIENVEPGDRYQFILAEQKDALPDPASRWQPDGVHAPSAVVDQSFRWNSSSWKGIPMEEMIIYELHVGTFTKQGTFDGIISKLDYLSSLGINTIELMPLAQFPGSRNWGYDGVFPFAVQHSYGGVDGLKRLVDAAHQRSIAVILDVVYNHQGPEGNYFEAFGPYFSDKYKTFWGKAINYDDAWCDGVRHFYLQNALQWLDEFQLDGLRLDAVHAIWDFGTKHFIELLVDHVRGLEKRTGRKKVLIAELDLNNPKYIVEKSKGGYGLDGQWIDEFHHALHALVTGETDGYYEDFGDVNHLIKSLQDSYVYTGEYSKHRKKFFGMETTCDYGQFVVFAQNHDQIGNRLLGDRLSHNLSFEALKLIAATVLLSPHVPLLFMGEEYGEKSPFQYFISHSDKTLIQNVRRGRMEEFRHFGWKENMPDPQAESTFLACQLTWDIETHNSRRLLSLYRYLINLRKKHPAFRSRKRKDLVMHEPNDRLIAFDRRSDNDGVLIILNFGTAGADFCLSPERRVRKIFDSSTWAGSVDETTPNVTVSGKITAAGMSAQVYEYG